METKRHHRPQSSGTHRRRTRVRVIFSTLVMLTLITLIAGIYGQKLIGGSASAAAAPASGLDCGCTKTGDYKEPAQGVKPTLKINGNSPHDVYNVSTQVIDSSQQIVQVTVKRNASGNPVVLSLQLRGDSNWGFFTLDSTDKRLVIQNMNAGQHTVMLYALEKIDPQTNQALKLKEMSQHAASAVVRFSPAGKYLFYSSIVYLGDVPTNQLQFVDASTGADVYHTEFIPRSAPGTPDDTFGSASWGWGPDTRDRTFAVENVTGQNQTLFAVVNLEAQATVVSELQGAISGYWVFSPCGDVVAMVEQTAPTTLDVWLRSTLDGHSVATTGGITDFGPVLSTTTANHQIKYGPDHIQNPVNLALNVAPQSCPVVVPTPVNDSFAKATTLANDSGSWSGNNSGATKEAGEPNHAGDAGSKSVWFTWTATSSGRAQFNTSGSTFNTLLAAYTGSTVGALTPVASNANGKSSTINFPVASGTTYKIALDGAGGASGNYSLNYQLSIAPGNDKFSNASVIPSASATGSFFGATQNATKEAGEPDHAGDAGGRSIWFSWVAPSSGYITLTTTGSDFDTLLAAYTGSAVGALTPVASDHTGTSSTVSFPVLANDSYKIAVDGVGGVGGSARLSWQFKQGPANDFFSHPTAISGDGATVTGTSLGGSKEAGEPAHGGDAGSASVWYVYTATADGTLRVEAAATNPVENLDMLLGVYTGTRVDQLTLVRGNDDAPNTKDSRVRFRVSAGQTYYIAVDSKKRVSDTGATLPQGGSFSLTYTVGPPPPANDDFVGALSIAPDTTEFSGDNSGALAEEGEPAHSGHPAESSVWYSWTAPEDGTSTVRVCSVNSLYRVSVYTGQEVNNLDCVGCRSYNAEPQSGLNRQDIEVTKGTTYYIAVDGGDTEGQFNVTLTPPDSYVTKFDPKRIPLPVNATGLIPRAFNDSDAVVGLSFHHTPNQKIENHAFIYEGGQTTELGEWQPNGINNLREIVGATFDTGEVKPHAVLWRDGQLSQLDFGALEAWQTQAVAINDHRPHAQIVGWMEFNDNGSFHRHAFLYEDGQVTDLGTLGGVNSEATSINNAGQIVGVSDTTEGEQHAFLYEQGVMKDIGPIPDGAPYSLAHGLSSTGSITGNGGDATPDPARTAFLRTPDGALELLSGASCDGPEPGPGYGLAVNRNDIVVGATANHYFRSNAFLYHKGVLFNLDALVNQTEELPQDWSLTHAVAVGDHGQVLAYQGEEGFEFASGYLLRPTRQLKPAPTYTLTGRVVNSAGIGLSGINVKLDGTKSATATTDASGEYRFESLPADGSYRATPTLDGSEFAPASLSVNDLRQDQSLEDIVLVGAQPTPTPTPTPTPSVNLSITETASAGPVEVGRIFTYNISVSNTGPDTATGVNVTDALPAGVTYTSASPTQGDCALASGTLTCQLGSIAPNGSAAIALQVKPRQLGSLSNTASVTASEADSDASNNSVTSNINAIKTADLKVAKTASAETVFGGGQVTYTTLVTNLGPVNGASDVTLTDSLPSGMTFVSATTTQGSLVTPPVGSSGIVTASIGTLAVGAQATVTVTARAAQSGIVASTATVSSNETDTNTANNTATQTTTIKDAALQKILLAKQVLTGGCENTTGNVYLTGPAPSGGVTVPLSSNITGASVPASVFIPAGQTVSPAFNVTTSPATAKQVGLITAGSGSGSVSRGITINVGSGSCQ